MRFAVVILLLAAVPAYAQIGFPAYHSQGEFSMTSPGALKAGLYGYDNPALLTMLREPDMMFTWTDATGKWNDFNRWGLFLAVPNLGFSVLKQKFAGGSVTDYRLSAGFGDHSACAGIGYGWSGGDKGLLRRSNILQLGTLIRPNRYLSFGLAGTAATDGNGSEATVDLAGRPLGNELVTLFADFALQSRQSVKDGAWSAGVALEALPGVRLTGRYFSTKAFTVGFQLSLGRAGFSAQAQYDADRKHRFNSYAIRLGAFDRTLMSRLSKNSRYVELNLNGPIKYRRFLFFDRSNTLIGLLDAIGAAKEDPAITGIAVNTSGMVANREFLWELREKLKEFKAAGKHVVMFVDRAGMNEFHFVSVADRIVLDPMGIVGIPGHYVGRTYLKGTLDKLGIGYDEWRYQTYKSMNENLSRENMSDADREQWQRFIDMDYEVSKRDICEGRALSGERFDRIVNDEVVYSPVDAVAQGLVDTLGRWDEVKQVIARLEGGDKRMVSPGSLARFIVPTDDHWSEKPRIAVVYALGDCAMDEGINARSLVKDLENVTDDRRVKAVILRVDSPGGDGLAADVVAEALKKCKVKKPVIVSQGSVAASSGYWISMYADTIVAAPNTLGGSIGVVGGWLYDKGLKEKLGMSTDVVRAGKHADLGFGFRLPYLGVGLPDRNLTDEERGKVEKMIKSMYKEFVDKVAAGRKTTVASVESVAQGRIWSGEDAVRNGLVDMLGGLETAIAVGKDRAGIPADQEVTIVELPRPPLFDFSGFVPRLIGVEVPAKDPLIEHLKFRLRHNGEPLPLMPLDQVVLPPVY